MLKALLKFILLALGSVVVLAVAVMALVLWKPEDVLTPPRIHWLASKLKPMGYDVKWDSDDIKIKSHSLFEKELSLYFKNLCLDLPSVEVKGCFEELKVEGTLAYTSGKIHLLDLGPVAIASKDLSVNLKSSKNKPAPTGKPGIFSELITHFSYFHNININIQNFKYYASESPFEGDILVTDEEQRTDSNLWILTAKLNAKDVKNVMGLEGKISLKGDKTTHINPLKLLGNLSFTQGADLKITSKVEYKFLEQDSGDYKLTFDVHPTTTMHIPGEISGKIEPLKTGGSLNAEVIAPDFTIPLGDKGLCTYDVLFKGQLKLNCPLEFVPKIKVKDGLEVAKYFEAVGIKVGADLQSTKGLDFDVPWNGQGKIEIKTAGGVPFDLNGEINSKFSKEPLDAKLIDKLKVQGNLKFLVSKFQDLVTVLKKTPYNVPAPLNVLNGSLQCGVHGDFSLADLKAPVDCNTDLKSDIQALKIDANGSFGLVKGPKYYDPSLDLKVILQNIQLALPRFGVKGPPPLFPDARFKKSIKVKTEEGPTFSYKINVVTSETTPVKILSNFSKTSIPLDINMLITSSGKPEGWVKLKEFTAELFRRKAMVKYLNLRVSSTVPEVISGLVEVHYTDYVIKITLAGTSKDPTVTFDSVPPLSQDDIVTVLLFGKTANAADTDQTSSVSNTQAAVTDKALALSSMYILASTPVESIGYDSQSQAFTAKIHLAEGTSLNVGANQTGLAEVGINRHLGGPWYIYTYLKNPTEGDDRSTAAFLEWVLRY